MNKMTMHVYTDGACSRNGSKHAKGGTGVFFEDGHPGNNSGRPREGMKITNQTMELLAIVRALEALRRLHQTHSIKGSVVVHSDSVYSIKCVTIWLSNWQANHWMTAAKKPVKNKELIVEIADDLKKLKDAGLVISFKHVRAHRQPPVDTSSEAYRDWKGNDRADKLATAAVAKS